MNNSNLLKLFEEVLENENKGSFTCISRSQYKDEYEEAMKAIANSDIPNSEKIVLTDNGFHDLETKGLSGRGIWVGFQHTKGYTFKKMYSPMKKAANLVNEVLFDGDGVVEDRTSSTDMFRIYKAE